MKNNIKKSESKKGLTAQCPSCGKSVPKHVMCRECGASMGSRGRISLKRINLCVLFLGLLGISLLFYAYYEANYITPIGEITPDMEGQIVRVSGLVIDVYYDESCERTSFTVMDKTGTINFFGWSDFTSDLQDAPSYPSIGDNITVEGSVNVYNNQTSIELTNVNSFKIIWVEINKKDITDILRNDLYSKVRIKGNVTDKYIKNFGTAIDFISLEVTDDTGSIDVFITDDQLALAGEYAILPNLTQTVEIIGMVGMYSGTLQIIPSNATSAAINVIGVDLKERKIKKSPEQTIPGFDMLLIISSLSISVISFMIFKKKKIITLKEEDF